MKTLLAFLALTLSASAAVDYPVIAVKTLKPDDTNIVRFPEVINATKHKPSDLVILRPDGTVETLLSGNGVDALLSPTKPVNGWVYYVRIEDANNRADDLPANGSNIYRIHLATKKIVRVTDNKWILPGSVGVWAENAEKPADQWNLWLPGKPCNLGPCPVPGGKLVFTSSRRAYKPIKGMTNPNLQLHILDDIPGVTDEDGEANRNTTCTGHLNLGSAQDPVLMTTGEIMWASYESQGRKDSRLWGIWKSNPDVSKWSPVYSAFQFGLSWHFQTQRSDGSIAALLYYNLNNNGTGALLESPLVVDSPEFLSPDGEQNKIPLHPANYNAGENRTMPFPFMRRGMYAVTPWITVGDDPNTTAVDGVVKHLGKVTHPAGAPGNHLLVSYSSGPSNDKGTHLPIYHFSVGVIKTKTTKGPEDIEILLTDPGYHFTQPQALVEWKEIYGSDPPEIPITPNPEASPFGIVGSSSAHIGQWKPRNKHEGRILNFYVQGFDAGQDIDETGADKAKIPFGIDIVAQEPSPLIPRGWRGHNAGGWYTGNGGPGGFVGANERLRLLARIKFDEPDRPAGDTSWWAEIPGDTSFTFRTFDKDNRTITFAQTWHQVRPGEVRIDCGGCHNHNGQSIPFAKTGVSDPAGTYASTRPYKDFRDTPLRIPEFNRDVLPIFQAKCHECHNAEHPIKLDSTLPNSVLVSPGMSFSSRLSKAIHGEGTTVQMPKDREPLTPEEIQKIDEWIDFFCLVSSHAESTGKGAFADNTPPTLYVPRSGELKIGAVDYYRGLAGIPSVSLNGEPLTLTPSGDGIWTTGRVLKAGDLAVVSAKDNAGNETKTERFIPSQPEPPADEIEELRQRILTLEAQVNQQAAKLEEFWNWMGNQPKP